MAEPMNVKVVSPEMSVYDGPASSLVAPAWDGRVGILPGHAPMLTLLGAGELAVDIPGGGSETFYVAGGVIKVEGGIVTVLTEYAGSEAPELIPDAANFVPADREGDSGD
jgi:F-type H+-transporting ATPase subunit epsilon